MPKYKVLALSHINGALHEEGDIVDYEGEPGSNLEPVDKAAHAAVKDQPSDAAQKLIASAREHAAAQRGVDPNEVNASDFSAVIAASNPKPSADVIAEATAACKVTLDAPPLA